MNFKFLPINLGEAKLSTKLYDNPQNHPDSLRICPVKNKYTPEL